MSRRAVRPEDDEEKLPLLAAADVSLAISELGHAVLSRLVTASTAERLAQPLARLAVRLRPAKRRWLADLYRAMLGDHAAAMPPAEDYVPGVIASLLRQRMAYARLGATPEWRPSLEVEGAEAVTAALGEGRGVLFWTIPMEMTALLLGMAAQSQGWGLHHLSRWQHGQSVSALGIATVNRRDHRIEERLMRRLVITPTDATSALAEAESRLAAGGCVNFRGVEMGQRPVYYPFFNGHMHLTLGAPVIARRAGAALFTVSSMPSGDGYRLCLQPLENARQRPVEEVGREFSERLQRAVLAAPYLWNVKSRQWAPGVPPVPFGKRLRPQPPL